MVPSQSLSMPSQSSVAPGLIAGLVSSQSPAQVVQPSASEPPMAVRSLVPPSSSSQVGVTAWAAA